jgi:hypothetical protein
MWSQGHTKGLLSHHLERGCKKGAFMYSHCCNGSEKLGHQLFPQDRARVELPDGVNGQYQKTQKRFLVLGVRKVGWSVRRSVTHHLITTFSAVYHLILLAFISRATGVYI